MRLNLSADEVLTTTRSVRKRLDFDRPVERDVVMECLDIALQAPTGSNSQGWQWVFVEDADKKQQLRDIYRANFRLYRDMPRPKYEDADPRAGRQDAVIDSADYLAENFHRAPLLLIPCLKGKPDVLAVRERVIGSAGTTLHLINGGEERVAELLGIPFDRYSQAGLFPIAYTQG